MSVRLTSSLNPSRNDTGRVAFCGPTVLSAITGFPVSRIETIIHQQRADPAEAKRIIEGTYPEEVGSALAVFGYGMDEVENFLHAPVDFARRASQRLDIHEGVGDVFLDR